MSLGKMFISAVLAEKSVAAFLQHGPIDHLFKASEAVVYEFVRDFVKQYHSLPTPETVEAHTDEELVPHSEPAAYYFDLLEMRHVEMALKQGMKSASDLLLPENKDPMQALQVLTEAAMQLIARHNAKQVVDFRDAYDALMADYVAKWNSADEYGLQLGWPTLDKMTGGLVRGDVLSMIGRPGQGKALAHGTPVLLRDGTTKMVEEIAVGDELASIDGAPSKVFGVYAQGPRAIFRVTFGDGRHLDVDGDHLWQVGCKYWDRPRVMSTHDIIAFREKASRYQNTLWVPLFAGEYGSVRPLMDPYLLGVLLGDGSLTQSTPTLTSMDAAVVARVEKALPSRHVLVPVHSSGRAQEYTLSSMFGLIRGERNAVKSAVVAYGLWGKGSLSKFIPESAFAWSREDRLALLQGLMDADGTVGRDGTVTFGSSSRVLTEGVVRLVRSLGGKARMQKAKKTKHADHYRCAVMLRDRAEAFSLPRKKERCRAYTTHDPDHLRIVSVEALDVREATCLAVTHPSRLFIAGDFVVTHNTMLMLAAAVHGWRKAATNDEIDQSRMFVSMEMDGLPLQQRLAAMQAQVPAGQLKHATLTTKGLGKLKSGLTEIKGYASPFWVVDGNLTSTVEDIWVLARQLKPAAIFIDGGYLVKHPTERDRYRRVAENADLIKSELAAIAPTVCSWQFAKSAAKKNLKKGDKPTLEDIGYSDAIAQVSSIVLGLFEEESVETLKQRRIEILKGRGGEVGSFRTRWDWVAMDFSEIEDEEVSELQFL